MRKIFITTFFMALFTSASFSMVPATDDTVFNYNGKSFKYEECKVLASSLLPFPEKGNLISIRWQEEIKKLQLMPEATKKILSDLGLAIPTYKDRESATKVIYNEFYEKLKHFVDLTREKRISENEGGFSMLAQHSASAETIARRYYLTRPQEVPMSPETKRKITEAVSLDLQQNLTQENTELRRKVLTLTNKVSDLEDDLEISINQKQPLIQELDHLKTVEIPELEKKHREEVIAISLNFTKEKNDLLQELQTINTIDMPELQQKYERVVNKLHIVLRDNKNLRNSNKSLLVQDKKLNKILRILEQSVTQRKQEFELQIEELEEEKKQIPLLKLKATELESSLQLKVEETTKITKDFTNLAEKFKELSELKASLRKRLECQNQSTTERIFRFVTSKLNTQASLLIGYSKCNPNFYEEFLNTQLKYKVIENKVIPIYSNRDILIKKLIGQSSRRP